MELLIYIMMYFQGTMHHSTQLTGFTDSKIKLFADENYA